MNKREKIEMQSASSDEENITLESETNFSSRTNLIKRNNDYTTESIVDNVRSSTSAALFKRREKLKKRDVESLSRKLPKAANRRKDLRNVDSTGSVSSFIVKTQPIDVVVDVHRENEINISNLGTASVESVIELSNEISGPRDNTTDKKTIFKQNNGDEDSIREMSLGDHSSNIELADKQMHSKDMLLNTSLKTAEEETKRHRRKRWSKDTNILRLPKRYPVKKSSSSENSVVHDNSWQGDEESVRIPTLVESFVDKVSPVKKIAGGVQNAAFEFEEDDNNEVLTIETDTRSQKMKMMLRSVGDSELDSRVNFPVSHGSETEMGNSVLAIEARDQSDAGSDHQNSRSTSERRYSSDIIGKAKHLENLDSNHNMQGIGSSSSSKSFTAERRRSSRVSRLLEKSDDEENHKKSINQRRDEEHRMKRRSSSNQDSNIPSESSEKRKKKKRVNRKRKKKELTENREEDDDKKKELRYISVMIHRTDVMEVDFITRHPMVKVHLVESSTGNYLKNSESSTIGSAYLQPLVTGTFDFEENRSMIPHWNEELIFEHDFQVLLKNDNDQILLLFEVVDLLTFAEASFSYDQFGSDGCWYKIAWAFLRPISKNGTLHIDKKIRLQLYRPGKSAKRYTRHKCEVWTWWKSDIREKYRSSLFVTVSSVKPPELEPIFYGHLTLNELPNEENNLPKRSDIVNENITLPRWNRLAAQSCKIPNELFFETENSDNGSFYVGFSNNGKYLAYTKSEEFGYPIVVYSVDQGSIHIQFLGHNSFVYALDWSQNDEYLLSVSSDQTARLWDVRNKLLEHTQILPHPSYVYCGKFDPENPSILATGCHDHVTRMWIRRTTDDDFELLQELEAHEGFVNSMCFQKDGGLLTADNAGVIIQWSVKKNRGKLSYRNWHISKKIKIREINGIPINTIVLHPLGSRLLVHSRDNGLRMLDLATGIVLQKYEGLMNLRIQTTARISPCGGLVICGDEDSILNIWGLESGKRLAMYEDHRGGTITCVDYHPYDHVLAYSVFGYSGTVRVLRFVKSSTGDTVNLKLSSQNEFGLEVCSNSLMKLRDASSKRKATAYGKYGRLNPSPEVKEHNKGASLTRRPSDFMMACASTEEIYREASENEEKRRGDLQSRFRILNESGGKFKGKSANRLTNIIEKIDRILSTTSTKRSPLRNVETDQSVIGIAKEDTKTQIDKAHFSTEIGSKKRNRRKRASSKYFDVDNSSTTDSKNDLLEMTVFSTNEHTTKQISRGRSQSATVLRSSKTIEETSLKPFSDGATNEHGRRFTKNYKIRQKVTQTFNRIPHGSKKSESSETLRSDRLQNKDKLSELTDDESTADSGGTYVVQRDDLEHDVDLEADIAGSEVQSNSCHSDATFVVENEKPIPKPRKRNHQINKEPIAVPRTLR